MANEPQQKMQEEFLHALENSLGIKHTPISLSKVWGSTAPKVAEGKSLTEYMEKVSDPRLTDGNCAKAFSPENGSISMMDITSTMILGKSITKSSGRKFTQAPS